MDVVEETLLKEAHQNEIVENRKIERPNDIKNDHEERYKGKGLHGQFWKGIENVKGEGSWDWMKKGYLKKETESTIVAAQDQALCTRNMRENVFGENVSSFCRVCGQVEETVAHIVAECSKLARNFRNNLWHKLKTF